MSKKHDWVEVERVGLPQDRKDRYLVVSIRTCIGCGKMKSKTHISTKEK